MATRKIHASPTKDFFVRMITKDISLVDCILDLIDNSLDGARKALGASGIKQEEFDYTGYTVAVNFDGANFSIEDNCGGIKISEAVDYAFHFGRRPDSPSDGDYSIGLYGIGMKRAIFKIGKKIKITSSTDREAFVTTIDVDEWISRPPNSAGTEDWDFDMVESDVSTPGTKIFVEEMHADVVSQFIDPSFVNGLVRIIGRDYSQYLSKGFEILINKRKVPGFGFTIRESESFKPVRLQYKDVSGVTVQIFAGMSGLPPDDLQPTEQRPEADYYGWFVVCNDRVVVAADKTEQTVWGTPGFPSWHFQYNGFIGVVSFEAKDPSLLPWRTTKRDVDVTNAVYRRAIEKMKEVTRIWIKYTNERKINIEAAKIEEAKAVAKPLFETPPREKLEVPVVSKTQKVAFSSIQYSKPTAELSKVKKLLGNVSMSNARAGELTFEYYLSNEGAD